MFTAPSVSIPPVPVLARPNRSSLGILVLLLAVFIGMGHALAQETGQSSGLPLPRFASLRSTPTNVRVGPGTRYEVAWVFNKSGVPVEIIQEFDTWRKIRDVDGEEGWIHQNLLVGDRAGYITPWIDDNKIALRTGPGEDSPPRAWLTSHLLVAIDECDGSVCRISARDNNDGHATYSGYVDESDLWGAYPGEKVD